MSEDKIRPSAGFAGIHAEITNALKMVEFGIDSRALPPAQRGVLIETGDGTARFHAFDFDTAVTVTVPCADVEQGASLLDFSELKKTLAAMVAGETKTAAARTPVRLTGDLLATNHLTVPVTALDLPTYTQAPTPPPAIATTDAQHFLDQLIRVLPAVCKDDTLPTLTGVSFQLTPNTLTLAATDRYRLAVADLPVTANTPETVEALVPGRALERLATRIKDYDGPLALSVDSTTDPRWLTLTTGRIETSVRLLDGRLPRYERLLPRKVAASLAIDRDALVRATKKAAAVLRAKRVTDGPVTLLWDATGALTLAPELPEGRTRVKGVPVPCTLVHGALDDIQHRTLSFRPGYLSDALAAFTGDRIVIHLQEDRGNVAFDKGVVVTAGHALTGDNYRHLLMPVRIDT